MEKLDSKNLTKEEAIKQLGSPSRRKRVQDKIKELNSKKKNKRIHKRLGYPAIGTHEDDPLILKFGGYSNGKGTI